MNSFRLQYGGDLVERLSGGLSLGIERIVGQWFLLVSDANRDGSFCENYLSMSVEPNRHFRNTRMVIMRTVTSGLALLIALTLPVSSQTRIDAIKTAFRWIGPNDRIIVERYDDPKVANVSCYMSRADTGGIKGGLGLAEDPSHFPLPAGRSDQSPRRQGCRSRR